MWRGKMRERMKVCFGATQTIAWCRMRRLTDFHQVWDKRQPEIITHKFIFSQLTSSRWFLESKSEAWFEVRWDDPPPPLIDKKKNKMIRLVDVRMMSKNLNVWMDETPPELTLSQEQTSPVSINIVLITIKDYNHLLHNDYPMLIKIRWAAGACYSLSSNDPPLIDLMILGLNPFYTA